MLVIKNIIFSIFVTIIADLLLFMMVVKLHITTIIPIDIRDAIIFLMMLPHQFYFFKKSNYSYIYIIAMLIFYYVAYFHIYDNPWRIGPPGSGD